MDDGKRCGYTVAAAADPFEMEEPFKDLEGFKQPISKNSTFTP